MGSSGQRTDPMEINGPAGQGITTADAFANYADDEPGDALPFYEAEGRILALWDQLNELKLEIALMEAQANPPAAALQHSDLSGENGPPNEETLNATLKEAERDCLEARAAYTLRQSVVESVLVTAPILKAVHAGSNPTPTERSLRPLIDRRDILSIASTNLSSILQTIKENTSKIEADRINTMKKNRDLAPVLIALAREVRAAKDDVVAASSLKEQLEEARDDSDEARKRWRIMKSVVAGVVAGSGVDWASDDLLRELVLDDETEDSEDM